MSEAARELPNPVAEQLLAARTVLLFGEIDTAVAERVGAQLLALSARSTDPILVVLNSQGGHVEAGDTLHDLIRFVEPEVRILGTGWVASAGALIYLGARKENRLALPNTRFLLHQPLGGVTGRASEIEVEAEQILAMRERLNRIFAGETGQPLDKVRRDTEQNHWLTATEAQEYGLVGRIVASVREM